MGFQSTTMHPADQLSFYRKESLTSSAGQLSDAAETVRNRLMGEEDLSTCGAEVKKRFYAKEALKQAYDKKQKMKGYLFNNLFLCTVEIMLTANSGDDSRMGAHGIQEVQKAVTGGLGTVGFTEDTFNILGMSLTESNQDEKEEEAGRTVAQEVIAFVIPLPAETFTIGESLKDQNETFSLDDDSFDYEGTLGRTFEISEVVWNDGTSKVERHLFYTPLMAGTVSPSSLGHSRVLGHSHTLSHTRAASTSAEDVEDSYPQWMAAWLDPNTPHKLFKTCEGQDAVTGDGTDQNSSVVEGLRL